MMVYTESGEALYLDTHDSDRVVCYGFDKFLNGDPVVLTYYLKRFTSMLKIHELDSSATPCYNLPTC